jgi:mannose-1-phosphate guanylyltransferase/mannose-6-phosphate isomerase-like protein (cupin superfamily)
VGAANGRAAVDRGGTLMYAIILAGGGGTRLWPLSAPEAPKPFLPLLGPRSLLADTVRRILDGHELPLGPSDVTVVADQRFEPLVRRDVPQVKFLAEPTARNTAAAIALAAAQVERPMDDVMLVLPADHAIDRPEALRAALRRAAEVAAGRTRDDDFDALVTLGVTPDRPATEYGYLLPATAPYRGVSRLAAFEEKPNAERAAELIAVPGVAWNAGIFVWRRQTIVDALRRWTPELWAVANRHLDPDAWAALPSISIDYAVMEPAAAAGCVATVRTDAGWNDIGTWSALLAALGVPAEGFVVAAGGSVEVGPEDLVVRRARGAVGLESGPASLVGLPGPVAVLREAAWARPMVLALLSRVARHVGRATPPAAAIESVSGVLGLAPAGRRVDKPWGHEVVWAETERYAGKLLVIEANAQLSLQLHDRKDESILVLSGQLGLLLEGDDGTLAVTDLGPGDTARVPARRRHRFMARTRTQLIEVSSPELDDVIRLSDDYGRAGTSAP